MHKRPVQLSICLQSLPTVLLREFILCSAMKKSKKRGSSVPEPEPKLEQEETSAPQLKLRLKFGGETSSHTLTLPANAEEATDETSVDAAVEEDSEAADPPSGSEAKKKRKRQSNSKDSTTSLSARRKQPPQKNAPKQESASRKRRRVEEDESEDVDVEGLDKSDDKPKKQKTKEASQDEEEETEATKGYDEEDDEEDDFKEYKKRMTNAKRLTTRQKAMLRSENDTTGESPVPQLMSLPMGTLGSPCTFSLSARLILCFREQKNQTCLRRSATKES